MLSVADIRKEYRKESLLEKDMYDHPLQQFHQWWQQAIDSKIEEVNAMTLATVDDKGCPAARIVLLKGYDEKGFVFFTNYESDKGKEIAANNNVCLVFFWKELERQVRVTGKAIKISSEESDDYFNSRPFESRVGAWSSNQSCQITSREELKKNFEAASLRFSKEAIFRPSHWGGYVVDPQSIEFWQGRPNRLHDRILYEKDDIGRWRFVRLSP